MADVKKAFEEWAENAELKNRGINKEEARKVFYDGFNIGSEQTFEEDMEVFQSLWSKGTQIRKRLEQKNIELLAENAMLKAGEKK